MSHNNKNSKLHREERERSAQRVKGNKGPAKTTPKHGKLKSNRWFMKGITAAGERALNKAKKG